MSEEDKLLATCIVLEQELAEAKAEIERLRASRNAWHKACRVLYEECQQGGSRGRPMDLISKRAWTDVVRLVAEAEDTLSSGE